MAECNQERTCENKIDGTSYTSHQIKFLNLCVQQLAERICDNVKVNEFGHVLENHGFSSHVIYKIHFSLNKKFKKYLIDEFEDIVKEDQLDDKFKNLNKLIHSMNSSDIKSVAWRPSGVVDEDLRSPLMSAKLKLKPDLKNMLEEKEGRIKYFNNKINTIREEANKKNAILEDRIDKTCENVEELLKNMY